MGKRCSSCIYFDYDSYWADDEEIELFICGKGHYDRIGWGETKCDDYMQSGKDRET